MQGFIVPLKNFFGIQKKKIKDLRKKHNVSFKSNLTGLHLVFRQILFFQELSASLANGL